MKENISIEMHEEIEVEAPMSLQQLAKVAAGAFYDTDDTRYNVLKSLFDKQKTALAEASGLDVDRPVTVHISEIKKNARQNGATELDNQIRTIIAKESGLDPSATLRAHLTAIWNEAYTEGINVRHSDLIIAFREKLMSASGLPNDNKFTTDEYIEAIRKKAVGDYIKKNPSTKTASMDCILKKLVDASGLPEDENYTIDEYIDAIKSRYSTCVRQNICSELSVYSDIPKSHLNVHEHVKEIKKKSRAQGVKTVKEIMAKESGLDLENCSTLEHINAIREYTRNECRQNLKRDLARYSMIPWYKSIDEHIHGIRNVARNEYKSELLNKVEKAFDHD